MTPKTIERPKCRGFGLIEVMFAIVVLVIGLVASLSMFGVAVGQNASQGEEATRTTEYAQDKMEQLMALSFSDGTTNTTVYPPVSPGGTGLGGTVAASATTGGINPALPVTGYVDYLDSVGSLTTNTSQQYYVRQWSITADATATLKTITVYAAALKALTRGAAPSTTLVCKKTQ